MGGRLQGQDERGGEHGAGAEQRQGRPRPGGGARAARGPEEDAEEGLKSEEEVVEALVVGVEGVGPGLGGGPAEGLSGQWLFLGDGLHPEDGPGCRRWPVL